MGPSTTWRCTVGDRGPTNCEWSLLPRANLAPSTDSGAKPSHFFQTHLLCPFRPVRIHEEQPRKPRHEPLAVSATGTGSLQWHARASPPWAHTAFCRRRRNQCIIFRRITHLVSECADAQGSGAGVMPWSLQPSDIARSSHRGSTSGSSLCGGSRHERRETALGSLTRIV